MMYYGEDLDYAKRRLQQTVVRLGDSKLAYILDVSHKNCVSYAEITPTDVSIKSDPIKLSDIDLTPINLGFSTNEEKGSVLYVTRRPLRKDWRQGLSETSCLFITLGGKEKTPKNNGQFTELLKRLHQPHFNTYPTLDQCLLSSKWSSKDAVAFSRSWCVAKDGDNRKLYYKTFCVGLIDESMKPVLDNDYLYLQECLEEAANG